MKYLAFFGLLLFFGCQSQNEQTPKDTAFDPNYFDLKGYFEEEIDRLQRADAPVRKRVVVNAQSEEKTLDTLDFEQELEVFVESDINEPDWLDKYQVDSTFQNNRLTRLTYQALDEQLRTRRLEINFADEQVERIDVLNSGTSRVAGSEQQLTYLPDSGYTITSRQYTILSKDDSLRIEVRFGAR